MNYHVKNLAQRVGLVYSRVHSSSLIINMLSSWISMKYLPLDVEHHSFIQSINQSIQFCYQIGFYVTFNQSINTIFVVWLVYMSQLIMYPAIVLPLLCKLVNHTDTFKQCWSRPSFKFNSHYESFNPLYMIRYLCDSVADCCLNPSNPHKTSMAD